jgi:hypothetical protein
MRSGGRSGPRTPRRRARLSGPFVLGVALLAVAAGTGAVALHIAESLETGQGVRTATTFLADFQVVATSLSTTPTPVPRAWSVTAGFPTHLGRVSATRMVNAGTAGDEAVEWTFNESTGLAAATEIEVELSVSYLIGAISHSFSATVYVESQARALPTPLTFEFVWDSGATTGVTPTSELALALVCSAVGTCP